MIADAQKLRSPPLRSASAGLARKAINFLHLINDIIGDREIRRSWYLARCAAALVVRGRQKIPARLSLICAGRRDSG